MDLIIGSGVRLYPSFPMLENVQQSGASNPDETERAEEGAWITDVSGPVKAFIHTRNARGVLAVDSMMLKDLRLAQAAARNCRAATPLGAGAAAVYERFIDSGGGNSDFSGIIRYLRGE